MQSPGKQSPAKVKHSPDFRAFCAIRDMLDGEMRTHAYAAQHIRWKDCGHDVGTGCTFAEFIEKHPRLNTVRGYVSVKSEGHYHPPAEYKRSPEFSAFCAIRDILDGQMRRQSYVHQRVRWSENKHDVGTEGTFQEFIEKHPRLNALRGWLSVKSDGHHHPTAAPAAFDAIRMVMGDEPRTMVYIATHIQWKKEHGPATGETLVDFVQQHPRLQWRAGLIHVLRAGTGSPDDTAFLAIRRVLANGPQTLRYVNQQIAWKPHREALGGLTLQEFVNGHPRLERVRSDRRHTAPHPTDLLRVKKKRGRDGLFMTIREEEDKDPAGKVVGEDSDDSSDEYDEPDEEEGEYDESEEESDESEEGEEKEKEPRNIHDAVLKELRATEFKRNESRQNVKQNAKADNRGFCVGAIKAFCWGIVASRNTREHPHLTRLLCRLIRRNRPGFRFTSIQINKNYASALHVDAGNLGPSYIFGMGDYKQGPLYIDGQPRGKKVHVRHTWVKFDGNIPHLTCPFQGERYTLIYFTSASYKLIKPEHKARLIKMGFNWPLPGQEKGEYPPKAERLEGARSRLPDDLKKCAGTLFQRSRGANPNWPKRKKKGE